MNWDSFGDGVTAMFAVALVARYVERHLHRKLDAARVELIVAQEDLIARLVRTVDKAAALFGVGTRIGEVVPFRANRPPSHYRPMPAGEPCFCVHAWQDAAGNRWCCQSADRDRNGHG